MLIESLKTLWLTLQTRIDALWGYDVFIAHRRTDAADYARSLFTALRSAGVVGFIDQVVYGPGDSLLVSTRRHARKSSLLVVVGSPGLMPMREPMDWVSEEITAYLTSHTQDPKVLLITFGAPILNALQDPQTVPGFLRLLQHFYRISESLEALHQPPSSEVVKSILWQLKARRRDKSRLRFFQGIAACLTVLLIALAIILSAEIQQRAQAERRTSQLAAAEARRLAPSQLNAALRQSVDAYRMSASDDTRAALLDGLGRAAHVIGFYPCKNGWLAGGVAFSTEAEPSVAFACTGDHTSVITLVAHNGEIRAWSTHGEVRTLAFVNPRFLALGGAPALRVLDVQTGRLAEFVAAENKTRNTIYGLQYADFTGHDVLLAVHAVNLIRIWRHPHGASPDSSWIPGDLLTLPSMIRGIDYNSTSHVMEVYDEKGNAYAVGRASNHDVIRKMGKQTSDTPVSRDTPCPQYLITSRTDSREVSHSPDGRIRAYLTEENDVIVEQGEHAPCTVLHGNTGYARIAVSANGQRIAASGPYLSYAVGLILWDLRQLHPLARVIRPEPRQSQARISKLALSYDGSSWVFVLPEGGVLWNGRSIESNQDPNRHVTAAALSPDGRNLALGFSDGQVARFTSGAPSPLDSLTQTHAPIDMQGSVDLGAFTIESIWYVKSGVYAMDGEGHTWKVPVNGPPARLPLPGGSPDYRCQGQTQSGTDLVVEALTAGKRPALESVNVENGAHSEFELPADSGD